MKLTKIKNSKQFETLAARLRANRKRIKKWLVVSSGTCGQARGSHEVIAELRKALTRHRLTNKVALRVTGCIGFCESEPNLVIYPERLFYQKLKPKDAEEIVRETIVGGKVLDKFVHVDPRTNKWFFKIDQIPFYAKQNRLVSGSNELIDPSDLGDYLATGGYAALAKTLAKMKPAELIDEVKRSGLRGRGGAGFPAGVKWEVCRHQKNDTKYVICNADEGDPGAYMDRSLLEGNPHSIIEGMVIGAYAIGATHGYIYVRTEYPLAIKNLSAALKQARAAGLLGKSILGSGFNFDIQIARGAGAFVCGEETALIASIEGRVGEPRQRPPFPAQKGLFGKPTNINNVETWATVPHVIRLGGAKFARIGTETSKGTKIFSLVGKIRNTGLVEVPMGITLKEIVEDIGGGVAQGRKVKAVQTGGPSGGCIPASKFDLPVDYESLKQAGSIMGSGGMIVMDDRTCMVDVAKYFMGFLKDESCGKCFTCRKGTQRLWELLDDITRGKGTPKHLELLDELAQVIKDTTMCGLGQSAPNPVLSTLRYFRNEYARHINDKRCDAYVCRELTGAPCQTACPIGTEAWRYVAHIRRGEYQQAYQAIREANPFPSVCARVCNHPCESWCRAGENGGQAVGIRALKRFITDRSDPRSYQAKHRRTAGKDAARIAVIGAGPAGLTAAHYLSLNGHKVTVFEADTFPGGMLLSCIPPYRLPREVIQKEIESLLNENIALRTGTRLGRDCDIDDLFSDGYQAVFLAMGAHRSRRLDIKGEDTGGVYPSVEFLRSFNLRNVMAARGKVGIVGGGNSAVDAARVALRQDGVESVTIFYRRTEEEMPALKEEIEAAQIEGVKLVTLTAPIQIVSERGHITALELIRNKLGDTDNSGRRQPMPISGSEFRVPLDTLVVAISEEPDTDIGYMKSMKIDMSSNGRILVDPETLATSRTGVFAGGDVVTGPSYVVAAIAHGKKVARVIDRYLRGEPLREAPGPTLPAQYVPPVESDEEDETGRIARAEPPRLPAALSRRSYAEVELSLSTLEAVTEAKRCLRCDLEFTKPKEEKSLVQAAGGKGA